MCTKDVVFCMKTTTCNNLLFHSCKKRCDLLIHDFLFQALPCCTIFTPLPFDDIYLIYLLCIINYLNMTTNEFIVERYYNRQTGKYYLRIIQDCFVSSFFVKLFLETSKNLSFSLEFYVGTLQI